MGQNAAGLPADAPDRAERYLFTALPELPARERRALALVTLAQTSPRDAGAEVGADAAELGGLLAHARKELRGARRPLPSAGRCERAEALVSARLDAPIADREARFLDAHLARCPRCREHVELLDAATAALRAGFAASLEVKPEPVAEPAGRLRVVPFVPTAPPEPETTKVPVTIDAPPAPSAPPEPEASKVTGTVAVPALRPPPKPPARRRRRRGPAAATVKSFVGLVALACLLAAIAIALASLGDNSDRVQSAPWSGQDAPDVRPAPLDGQ